MASVGAARVAVDMSGLAPMSDYAYTMNGVPATRLNQSANWRIMIRAVVTPANKMLIINRNYINAGRFLVKATLSNALASITANQSVDVQAPITGLSVGTRTCFLNLICYFQASLISGSEVSKP